MNNNSDELFWSVVNWLLITLAIVGFVVSAAFIVSVWLTKLLFKMINELTEGELDRNEALALLISAVVFGGAALLLLPFVANPSVPLEQTLGWLVFGGMAWGLAVGYKVLLDWWHELAMMELPEVHYSRRLNLPAQHYLHT